ncbi:hypothetical protein [Herbiconiux sp. YIM B11900]|uniref:hypothetical protein n=1 Tax=Herbiconiux sp. YIM B11900 TaxID=3404131 RepID=UPI003F870174
MPLPSPNTAWPPAPWDTAYQAYRENEAWYLGDVKTLESLYGNSQAVRPSHQVKGQPRAGGVVGAMSRFFWGRPVPDGENRTRLHVPAAADLASIASDAVFSDPPEVQLLVDTKIPKEAQARLDLIANSDAAHAMFNTMGELKSVFGATVIVSEWDTAIADNVWLSTYGVDIVIPEFRKGKLVAATMWTEYRDGSVYWRHLERHEPGMIEHALYQGSADKLGRLVPLQDRPETAYLAGVVNAESRILTGIDRLTVSYNLNAPTRAWRKKGELAYAGRSDFAGMHPLFDALDETMSSWMRDLKLGGGRVIMPQAFIDSGAAGEGGSFDFGREAFLGMPGLPGTTSDGLTKMEKVQFEIRVDDHERTANYLLKKIFRSAGQGVRGIGNDEAGDVTATGELARDKREEITRNKKILYDKQAIAEQSSVALELDGKLFPGKGGGRFDLPMVIFPDVSQVDPEKNARTIQLLDAAAAASIQRKVELANPDWDEKQVADEVALIKEERGSMSPDPSTFTGVDEAADDDEVVVP